MRRSSPAPVKVSSANMYRLGRVTFSVDAGLLEKSLHLSVGWAEDSEGLPLDYRSLPEKPSYSLLMQIPS